MNQFRRDIRADLRERIAHAHKMRDHFAALMREADAEINLFTKMLDAENARYHSAGEKTETVEAPEPKTPIKEFLLERLHAKSPMSKDELKDAALEAGYLRNSPFPGRSIHIVLVGLQRKGKVDIDRDAVTLKRRRLLLRESAGT